MPFTSDELSVRAVDDDTWELLVALVYQGRDERFVVPAGFRTDFASVPQAVQWLVPTTGRYTRSVVLHDWLCGDPLAEGRLSSHDVDGILRRVLREEGVPLVRRRLMWVGVRWGALVDPLRRPGWLRDAPAVVALSVLALPLVAPTLPVLVALAVDRLFSGSPRRR
ncbi:DUF1353 domain-containing protein [Pseudonocardia lacus]|uniref:DUF1353 domain-containing protein n=1 Tax=Pseudonocardia lacus TaxID=2835865 RepID=UPI001BDDAC85|nr:DUF1353 domain-containing protein [Pseudonocardia lacus]